MQPGEDFLTSSGSQTEPGDNSSKTPRKKRTTTSKGDAAKNHAAPKKNITKGRGRSGRKGPKAAIAELLQEGFFNERHTISQIRDQLQHKKGLSYKVTDLSPALVRMLREGTLDRERNEAGNYEYRAA